MIQLQQEFGCFLVNNSFVDKYMCEANGSFIKVYLYLLRHSSKPDLEISDIANALNLFESDVIRAFKYWQKMNVLEYEQISDKDFVLKFLPQKSEDKKPAEVSNEEAEEKYVISKMPSAPTSVNYTKSDINTYMRNNDGIRHMFLISEQLLCKTLTDTDRKILFSFYDYLSFPIEVIFTLLEYCISIGKTNMRYIEKVAYTWAEKGIDTLSKASVYVKEENELQATYKRFKTMFKITGREFTNTEEDYIKDWVYNLKFSDKQIKSAYEITVQNTGKIAFKYMDAVLKNLSSDKPKPENLSFESKAKPKRNAFKDYDNDISDFEVQLIQKRIKSTASDEV